MTLDGVDTTVESAQRAVVPESGLAGLNGVRIVVGKVADASNHGESPGSVVSLARSIMQQLDLGGR